METNCKEAEDSCESRNVVYQEILKEIWQVGMGYLLPVVFERGAQQNLFSACRFEFFRVGKKRPAFSDRAAVPGATNR